MFAMCMISGFIVSEGVWGIIVKMIVGGITYFLVLIILKDKYVYEVRDIVKRQLKRT